MDWPGIGLRNPLRENYPKITTFVQNWIIMSNIRDDIFVTYEGVICIPGNGYMHPYAFRDLMGENAYQEVINRPWQPSEYTNCDCYQCKRADEEENA